MRLPLGLLLRSATTLAAYAVAANTGYLFLRAVGSFVRDEAAAGGLALLPRLLPWGLLWVAIGLAALLVRGSKPQLALTLVLAAGSGWLGRSQAFLELPDVVKVCLLFLGVVPLWLAGWVRGLRWWMLAAPLAIHAGLALQSLAFWRGFFGLLLLALACLGLGSWLRSGFSRAEKHHGWLEADQLVLDVALGSACLSLLGLALAQVAWARAGLLQGCVVALTLVRGRFWLPRVKRLLFEWRLEGLTKAAWTLAGLACFFWGLLLFAALGPETGQDAIGGRVALPVRILTRGYFSDAHPLGAVGLGWVSGELFYLWLVPWVGTAAARLWAWWLTGLLLLWTVKKSQGKLLPLAAWLAVFASTQAWWQTFAGFVDMHQAFLTFAAVLALARPWPAVTAQDAGVALFLAGAAAATKMNGLSLVIALGLAVLGSVWRQARGEGWKQGAALLLSATLGLALSLGPWALRSLWLTGNPTYPFFNQLWQSPLAPLSPRTGSFGPEPTLAGWLALPWSLFFSPQRFAELGAFNPALLILLLLGAGLWRRGPAVLFLWCGGTWLLFWALTEMNSRYLLPAAVALVGAVGMVKQAPPKMPAVTPTVALVAVFGFFAAVMSPRFWPARTVNGSLFPLAVLLGHQQPKDFLQSLPTYEPCQFLHQRYGLAYKVWQADLRDFLYCQGEVWVTSQGDNRVARHFRRWLVGKAESFEEMLGQLRHWGFTHVMYRVDLPQQRRYRMRPLSVLSPGFESCCLVPEYAHKNVRVLRLADPKGKSGQWVACQQGTVAEIKPGELLYQARVVGGGLFRWKAPTVVAPEGGLTLTLVVRDRHGRLLTFHRQTWDAESSAWADVWHSLPAGEAQVQVVVQINRGKLQGFSCEQWRDAARDLTVQQAGGE